MFHVRIGDSLEIRPISIVHAEEIFTVVDRDRDHLRRWLPWVDGTRSAEDVRTFCRAAANQFAANDGFHAGIWEEGKLAGVIGHHHIDWPNRRTSIGYWLSKSAEGKGIMTTACRAIINYNLTVLDLNRVEIRCAVENHRSKAVPGRLGFKLEGTICGAEWLYDHFVDHEVYAMLKAEWQVK